jgi:hypothetical protein
MKVSKIVYVSLLMFCLAYAQSAQIFVDKTRIVPKLMNYQGYLTDTLGIPITDTLSMQFHIYDATTGGNELWSEIQWNVGIIQGIFHVILGSAAAIPDSVFTGGAGRWLQIDVMGSSLTPRTRITAVGYAYTSTYSDTAEYARVGAADNDWAVTDSVLYTGNYWGLARGSAGNHLYGDSIHTHVNFGVACTTGVTGFDYPYAAIGGGAGNNAAGSYVTIGGGYKNSAYEAYSTVSGGGENSAKLDYATVAGGCGNTANDFYSFVGSGYYNTAFGWGNAIAGGTSNYTSGTFSAICCGYENKAESSYAFIGTGEGNSVLGKYSAIVVGEYDTIAPGANHSYLFGIRSKLTQDSTFMVDMPHIRFGDETDGYEFPEQDGAADQVLVTDGSGQLSWQDVSAAADTDWVISGSDQYSGVSGNVGIGTTSPGAKLDVAGHIWQTGVGYSVFLGEGAGASDDFSTNNNIFVGYQTGYSNTTGSANTAIGCQVLWSGTDSYYNTACGFWALKDNTTGCYNTVSGSRSLCYNTSGSYNTASGDRALCLNTAGSYNIASGQQALYSNTTAGHNIAIGEKALFTQSYDNGGTPWNSWNIAIGDSALYSNQPTSTSNGYYNTALGHRSLYSNTTGKYNIACGPYALDLNSTGCENAAFGSQALFFNTTGWCNTAIGNLTIWRNDDGDYNTGVGYGALSYNSSGNTNTAVGYLSGPGSSGSAFSNTSALGSNACPTASNRVHIGNSAVGWIGGQVTWSTYSDERAKNNVRADIPGLAFITQLEPVSFNWDTRALNNLMGVVDTAQWDGRYDIEKKRISGFLAQDVAQAARECGYEFSGIDSTANVYSLSYAQFVVPLVRAVQEQQAQIEKQQAEIAELRAMIAALEEKIK